MGMKMKTALICATACAIICSENTFSQTADLTFTDPADRIACEREYMDASGLTVPKEAFMHSCAQRKNEAKTGANTQDKPDQERAIVRAKEVMQNVLKDPYSAHWECGEMTPGSIGSGRAWGGKDYSGMLLPCRINAKNSYGGYTGERQYVFLFSGTSLVRAAEIGASPFGATQRIVYEN